MSAAAKPPPRFNAAMMAIHWTTAALVVAVVVLAWTVPDDQGPTRTTMLLLHRSIGLTILALTAIRLIVRNASAHPDDGAGAARWEVLAARATHVLLYVILLTMPISGYFYSTARGNSVDVFGLFNLPPLLPASGTIRSIAWTVHITGKLAVYAIVGLHVAAALFHLVVRRDGVMARMLPGLTPPPLPDAVRPGVR